jgi:hypothetical protein
MHITTLLLLIVIIISFALSITLDSLTKNFSFTSIVTYLFGFLVYYLLILDQNCVTEGPCNVWGWVKVAFSIFIFIILIVTKVYMVMAATKEKKKGEETKST